MKRSVVLTVLAVLCIGAAVETVTRAEFNELKAEVLQLNDRILSLENLAETKPQKQGTDLQGRDLEAWTMARDLAYADYVSWHNRFGRDFGYGESPRTEFLAVATKQRMRKNSQGDYYFTFLFRGRVNRYQAIVDYEARVIDINGTLTATQEDLDAKYSMK